jgi:hypothetical protein
MAKDQASAAEPLWFLNGRLTILRSAVAAPDRVAIIEQVLPESDSSPLHLHAREDEVFHILGGVVRFSIAAIVNLFLVNCAKSLATRGSCFSSRSARGRLRMGSEGGVELSFGRSRRASRRKPRTSRTHPVLVPVGMASAAQNSLM